MTRVVAGTARGRRLAVPPRGTRPTADRVREALFSAAAAELGGLDGLAVLDLFAGSGALGLEAASRGAARVLLVERDPAAAAVCRANAAVVGAPGVEVLVADAERLVAAPGGARGRDPRGRDPRGDGFDLVLADPPYGLDPARLDRLLAAAAAGGWVAQGGLVVVERAARGPGPAWPAGWSGRPARRYGDTALWYGREVGAPATGGRPGRPDPGVRS